MVKVPDTTMPVRLHQSTEETSFASLTFLSKIDSENLEDEDSSHFSGDEEEENDDNEDSSHFAGDEEEENDDNNTSTSSHGALEEGEKKTVEIGASETKAVKRSKILVYLILMVFAFAASVLTWFFVRQGENHGFEKEFKVLAQDLLEGAESSAANIFLQLNTLSTALTSHALNQAELNGSNPTWPYVTLPHFYKKASELGGLSGSEIIIYTPRVPWARVDEWSAFVQTNQTKIVHDTFGPDATFETDIEFTPQAIPSEAYASVDLPLLEQDFLLPSLQYGPEATSSALINTDLKSHPIIQRTARDVLQVSHTLLSEASDFGFLRAFTQSDTTAESPRSIIAEPVYRDFLKSSDIVGFVFAVEPWEAYFHSVVTREVEGFMVDVIDSCGNEMTFRISAGTAQFLRRGDLHRSKYSYLGQRAEFATFARYDGEEDQKRHCNFSLAVYPSASFQEQYHTEEPYVYAVVVFSVFMITMIVFAFYDWMVQRRQRKVLGTAQRTTQIVQSLFPKDVGDRLMAQAEENELKTKNNAQDKMSAFLVAGDNSVGSDPQTRITKSDPIADLYPNCTIIFADVVGFTAWSSTREPKQVFTLLETIYADFDVQAHRRKVFKVETVGDCYVAVTGLPDARSDHAVAMARFACDIVHRFHTLSRQLEMELGPETADLALRIGLHSGPVTAGVLRGERARFQLFGDTMNTASRIESTSKPQRIQLSQETADLLVAAGKSHWLRKREELVDAKGKGKLQTYWLELKGEGPMSSSSGNSSENQEAVNDVMGEQNKLFSSERSKPRGHSPSEIDEGDDLKKKADRLVRWNAEVLSKILRDLRARRKYIAAAVGEDPEKIDEAELSRLEQSVMVRSPDKVILDEVQDVIQLPVFTSVNNRNDGIKPPLNSTVAKQLEEFVQSIASMYRENPFHNFEHAAHVTMSVMKLMSRIIAPTKMEVDNERTLHDHTYGITSDPLTKFACAFSALIHDVDHYGVPNSTLVQEKSALALAHKNKSVAEQNSVDIAWSLLMEDRFRDLRRMIYTTPAEFKRFRQLVVNLVMATDLMDKEVASDREKRWEAAFSESGIVGKSSPADTVNRKATIVLEHLIQASDVSHTMQHWQVYIKWNERLFMEIFRAYRDGRFERDPTDFWNNGEIGFFQNYIIPLAMKLKECGVFGICSDEYLNYATQNEREWQTKGKKIVAQFREAALLKYGALVSQQGAPDKSQVGLGRQRIAL